MTKIKVSELSGMAIIFAFAQAEGEDVSVVVNEGTPEVWFNHDINHSITYKNRKGEDRFILNGKPVGLFGNPVEYGWEHIGKIIEEECLDISCNPAGFWSSSAPLPNSHKEWWAMAYGPTPLIAVMRCLVTSRLGEEVEVPDELMKDPL